MLAIGVWIVEALAVIWSEIDSEAGVPKPDGRVPEPANVRRVLRDARGEAALAWLTSHTEHGGDDLG